MITGKIRLEQRLNPWKKGFKPSSLCPRCKQVNMLTFTGTRTEAGNHIYICDSCGGEVGSPTIYAYCEHEGDHNIIEKDVFYTPCFHGKCENISPGEGKFCTKFSPIKEGDADAKFRRHIEDTMIKTRVAEKQPPTLPAELGHGGMGGDLYTKLRRERLKRLETEKR